MIVSTELRRHMRAKLSFGDGLEQSVTLCGHSTDNIPEERLTSERQKMTCRVCLGLFAAHLKRLEKAQLSEEREQHRREEDGGW